MRKITTKLLPTIVGIFMPVLTCPVKAATNYTDLWWNPSESGWGVTMSQDYNGPIYATFFVYGSDGKPSWVAALLALDPATGNYTGAINETSGGASLSNQNFDAASVQAANVGNATFTPTDAANGTLRYTYRGSPVVKHLTRQSLYTPDTTSNATFLTFTPGGSAYQSIIDSRNNANCSPNYPANHTLGNLFRIFPTAVTNDAITMNIGLCDVNDPNSCVISSPYCTFTGTIQRIGQIMSVPGTLTCFLSSSLSGGLTGELTATFSEVVHTDAGVTGKLSVTNGACNVENTFLIQRNEWLNKVTP